MLVLGAKQYFPGDMGTLAVITTKSQLEGDLVGEGSTRGSFHCGQRAESFVSCLEEALVGEHAFES